MFNKENAIAKLTDKENKKTLWNHEFEQKVAGHKATLGGLGKSAVTLKLETNKSYPHLDIKCFLNWDSFEEWTDKEKQLVESLLNQL